MTQRANAAVRASSLIAAVIAVLITIGLARTSTGRVVIASVVAVAAVSAWVARRAHSVFAGPLPAVELDPEASRILRTPGGRLRLRVVDPGEGLDRVRFPDADVLVEVVVCTVVGDPVDLTGTVRVVVLGHARYGQPALLVAGPDASRAIAALLLDVRDRTGRPPQIRFGWAPGHPAAAAVRLLLFGRGDVATVTRELLYRAEPDATRRPLVRVS